MNPRWLLLLVFLALSGFFSKAASALDTIDVYYFYDVTCGICQEIRNELFPVIEKGTGAILKVHYLDIENGGNLNKLAFFEKKMGIQGKEFPVIIVGTNYLAGETAIKEQLQKVVASVLRTGTDTGSPSRLLESYNKSGEEDQTTSLAKSLTPLPVILSGLADGVNPCAFATLIFLLSYLFFVKMERRMVFRMGLAYTLGVFVCYFVIGLGAFSALKALKTYAIVSLVIKYASILLVVVFLLLTIIDIVAYLRTKKADFILQLPDSIKKMIHARIRGEVSPGISLVASFGLGAVIATFELACTGQIYLPIIIYVLQSPELKLKGISYLVLYNIAFILPLIAVFTMVWLGLEQEKLERVFKKNVIWLKVLLATVFALLLVYLLK